MAIFLSFVCSWIEREVREGGGVTLPPLLSAFLVSTETLHQIRSVAAQYSEAIAPKLLNSNDRGNDK
jgi:hypothetical protein